MASEKELKTTPERQGKDSAYRGELLNELKAVREGKSADYQNLTEFLAILGNQLEDLEGMIKITKDETDIKELKQDRDDLEYAIGEAKKTSETLPAAPTEKETGKGEAVVAPTGPKKLASVASSQEAGQRSVQAWEAYAKVAEKELENKEEARRKVEKKAEEEAREAPSVEAWQKLIEDALQTTATGEAVGPQSAARESEGKVKKKEDGARTELELKQAMNEKKAAFDAIKDKWEKNQGILGFFRRGKAEEKERIATEYEAAKKEYAKAKAEYVASKVEDFLEGQTKLVDGYAQIIARALDKKRGGKVREWFYDVYKKSGDWNIARFLKFEEKLAKWQPETKKGKVAKFFANLGSRSVSVRTLVSFSLLGGAAVAGSGLTFVALMATRRALAGFGGFFGTNEAWKGIESAKLLKEIPKDKVAKLFNEDLVERMRQIEVYNLMEGKDDFSGFGYNQLKEELKNRIENKRIELPTAEAKIPEGTAAVESLADQKTKERGEKVETKTEILLNDVNKQLEAVESKFKKSRTNRLGVSTAVAIFLGSGLFGEIIGRTWHGLFGSGQDMKEPIEAMVKKSGKAMAMFQQKIEHLSEIAKESTTQVKVPNMLSAAHEFQDNYMAAIKEGLEKTHLTQISAINKGEGVIHSLKRQLVDNPQAHGFQGNAADHEAVSHWADRKAYLLAKEHGYPQAGHPAKIGDQFILDEKDKIIEHRGAGQPIGEVHKPKLAWDEKWNEEWQVKQTKPFEWQDKWRVKPTKPWEWDKEWRSWDEAWEVKPEEAATHWREQLAGLTEQYPDAHFKAPRPDASWEEVKHSYDEIKGRQLEPPAEIKGGKIVPHAAEIEEKISATPETNKGAMAVSSPLESAEYKEYLNAKLPFQNRLSALKEMLPEQGKLNLHQGAMEYWKKGNEVWYKVPGAVEGPVNSKSIEPLTKLHHLAESASPSETEIEEVLTELREINKKK